MRTPIEKWIAITRQRHHRIWASRRDDDKRKTKARRHPPGYIPGALWPAKPRPRTSHPGAFPPCLLYLSPSLFFRRTTAAFVALGPRSPRGLRVCLPASLTRNLTLRSTRSHEDLYRCPRRNHQGQAEASLKNVKKATDWDTGTIAIVEGGNWTDNLGTGVSSIFLWYSLLESKLVQILTRCFVYKGTSIRALKKPKNNWIHFL